jgi:hypothetical protein
MSSHRRSEISGWRLKTKNEFKKLARQNTPTLVIHHPHTAIKRMTWVHAWGGLRRELPSVRSYIGTGCYSFRDKNEIVPQTPQGETCILRDELTDYEWVAIRPLLPNKPRGVPRVDETASFGSCARVRYPSQMRNKNQNLGGSRARSWYVYLWHEWTVESRRPIAPAFARPNPAEWSDNRTTAAWLGHAMVLINFFGIKILTDP